MTWQQPLDVWEGEARPLPQALVLDGNESGAEEPMIRVIGISGGTNVPATSTISAPQTQRITCCVSVPAADGPGFLVATKAGVISLFAPVSGEENSGATYDQVGGLFDFYMPQMFF